MGRSEAQLTSELVEKLGRWLEQQTEYPLLFMADRQTRRRAARLVAHRMFILPTVPAKSEAISRADARAAHKRFSKMLSGVKVKRSKRRARLEAKALRDHKRNARLSAERLAILADRAFEAEEFQYQEDA